VFSSTISFRNPLRSDYERCSEIMATALDRSRSAFRSAFYREPSVVARAPGRVNLIGEHTDYNDGFVLPFAIDRDVVVCASPAVGNLLNVIAADAKEITTTTPAEPPRSGAAAYISAVRAELSDSGIETPAATMSIAGDIPIGAGLSSSAAICCAATNAFLALAERTLAIEEIAQLCRRAEQRAVGVRCGIMDPFAVLASLAGHALLLDCRSLEYRHVRIPTDAALMVANSGASRTLAASAYNQRVAECAAAARRLGVRSLRDATTGLLHARAETLDAVLYRRARHVISENERTLQTAEALEAGNARRVGALMQESHESLRRDYEVSSRELDALVEAALQVPEVYGSRLTGAGFGGCTVSIMAPSVVAEFSGRVGELKYEVWRCVPSAGASFV
jgi:galactokinase